MPMISFFATILCVLMALGPASANSDGLKEKADAVLHDAITEGGLPGVIAMAATSDEVIYAGAAGYRDVASQAPMTVDTVVQIASMTKAVTSVAVMQLVEQGSVELDAPIGQYLPQLADTQVLEGFDADGEMILRKPASPPTVRQLLSHTSGYVYEIWNENALRAAVSGKTPSIMTGTGDFIRAPLAFDPGTQWEYGIGTDILGILVEAVSGQSLDAFFQEHIFKPLGMADTGFRLNEEQLDRLATTYSRVQADTGAGADTWAVVPYAPLPPGAYLSGGGGLLSTTGDYMRFLRALLNGGSLDGARILSQQSVEVMATNQIGELAAGEGVTTRIPQLSNTFDLVPGSRDGFGLGFLLNTEPTPGGRTPGSLAWAGLYNTYYWIDRERNICGVLMTQVLPFFDDTAVQVLWDFERALYGSLEVPGPD